MGKAQYDPIGAGHRAWNAGLKVGAKRALKPRQVWAIRFFLDAHRRVRDRALFDLATDSKLRGCDVVKVRIGDLVLGGQIRTRAIIIQAKAGKPVQFELMADGEAIFAALLAPASRQSRRRRGSADAAPRLRSGATCRKSVHLGPSAWKEAL
jgi:hypothetical protein